MKKKKAGAARHSKGHMGQEGSKNEHHLFYLDSERNRDYPTWFFSDCSRDDAESVLTVGRQHGNVIMRTSATFNQTGKYVISMRREIAGGTTLYHYEVAKHHDGYKINVDNHHSPMRCLSEVMDFFVSVAGPGTLPMKTNSKDRIFSKTGGEPHQGAARSGGLDNQAPRSFPSNNDHWSSSQQQPGGGRGAPALHTTGSVDPTIIGAVHDMNSQFTRRDSETGRAPQNSWPGEDYVNVPSMHGGSSDRSSYTGQSAAPPPPPPQDPAMSHLEVTDLHNPTHLLGPCLGYIKNGVQQVIFVTCLLDQTKCQSTAGQTPGL